MDQKKAPAATGTQKTSVVTSYDDKPPAVKHPFSFDPRSALERASHRNDIVDGVIPRNSLTYLVGPPGTLKTFVVVSLMAHVAAGRPWFGHDTEKARVLYIAGEGGDDIHFRRAAVEAQLKESLPVAIVQEAPLLDSAAGAERYRYLLEIFSNPVPRIHPYTMTVACALERDEDETIQQEEVSRRDFLYTRRSDVEKKLHDDPVAVSSQWIESLEAVDTIREIPPELQDECELHIHDVYLSDNFLYPEDAVKDALADLRRYRDSVQIARSLEAIGDDPNERRPVMVIVDTYSQIATNDEPGTVSKVNKILLTAAQSMPVDVSTIIVDHTTKSGDTWNGSQHKMGDADVMVWTTREKDIVNVSCKKMRSGPAFEPIDLMARVTTLEGYADAKGRPIRTLILQDGTQAAKIARAAGGRNTAAGIILEILTDSTGRELDRETLRDSFYQSPANDKKSEDTVKRNFNRALAALIEDEVLIEQNAGQVLQFPQPP